MQRVLAPFPVFGSMRFHGTDKTPMKQASELRAQLRKRRSTVDLTIVHVSAGESLVKTVMEENLAKSVAFVAMGSSKYGEKTDSKASTGYEIEQWNATKQKTWGPIIPVRLLEEGENFKFDMAKEIFDQDAMQLFWTEGVEFVANEIELRVRKLVRDAH